MSHDPHVRYVGPTTHLNDHRLIHAAKGLSNVWTAAIVAGLGVVLTATIAYGSVQAQEERHAEQVAEPTKAELRALNDRIYGMELKMEALEAKLKQPK